MTFRLVGERRINGVRIPAVIHNGIFFLTSIQVFQDGMIECWGELITFDQFKAEVKKKRVLASMPEGATVSITKRIQFKATEVLSAGSGSDLIKDVAGALDELNGRPPPVLRLINAMKRFQVVDTPEIREQLKLAFDDLPSYDRQFAFGSQMEGHKEIQRIVGYLPPEAS